MSGSSPVLIVDGFNLLLALVEREGATLERGEMGAAQERLLDLLETWAEARETGVVLVWDGAPRRGREHRGRPRVRVVFVDPPAEADDWIVIEADRLCEHRTPVRVVTRDRGLRSRLHSAARIAPLDSLVADLYAVIRDPLRAPFIGGAEAELVEIPASEGPVDTRRLPRRHRPPTIEEEEPAPPPTVRTPSPSSGVGAGGSRTQRVATATSPIADPASGRERKAREEAAARKERRREKYLAKRGKMGGAGGGKRKGRKRG